MRVLVTGGAGFIGSHIVDRMVARGHQVTVADNCSGGYRRNINPAATWWDGDLTWTNAQWIQPPDLLIHCAAYAAEGLSHWVRRFNYEQNLVAWSNLANMAADNGVGRIVFLSSMAVYGDQAPPFDESMAPRPADPYGAAKYAIECDLKALGRLHGIEWQIVRPHNVYGPRQNLADPYRNVVAIFLRQALAGEPITVYGDGLQRRAFSYIADIADGITRLALDGPSGVTVNMGGDYPITILGLAHLVKRVTGSDSPLRFLDPRPEVEDAWCSHDLLHRLVPGYGSTFLDVGIEKMADWARTIDPAPPRRYRYETTRNLYQRWEELDASPAAAAKGYDGRDYC